jgi:putative oxygen-independent coproporphyrinogen III oxidase
MKAEILILSNEPLNNKFFNSNNLEKSIAIYVHWPFCLSKCPYCDFNSHTFKSIDYALWQQSYLQEIQYFSSLLQGKYITSIFFGGGTPSLMTPLLVESIIDRIASLCIVDEKTEITLEANPTSVESTKFADFKLAGVNRVSLGIQSFNEQDLKFLGRQHSAKEAIAAIKIAASVFKNYSFDLIYARPGQSMQKWQQELELAISLASKHISLYQLTIEKGTEFYSMYHKGKFALPSQDLAFELYDMTNQTLQQNGYQRYEISNYAASGFESKHNLNYWRYGQYLGIGPGAHSRINSYDNTTSSYRMQALEMIYNPQNWLTSVKNNNHGLKSFESLSKLDVAKEILMMGLRLIDGIDQQNLAKFVGKNFAQLVDAKLLKQLANLGLLCYGDEKISLSNSGLMLHSKIISQIFAVLEKC